MNDKELIEDLLLTVKRGSDLLLHGTIEASTQNVYNAFDRSLNDTLKMQNELYCKMSDKGWYSTEQEDQNKIDKAKQKFSSQQ
ncbi:MULTISPECIES: spore coat protein [unclassified Clostridium]|uniref:spore coat protein n=1 Tax=unclassified Clostridium TaxID=2614128 RepID=UPI0002973B34|nr:MULTISPECIES: spore coat protein [unclassified Clostridium]EKQ51015.1 MAG: coat F domain-containing protein [Clostridium sp. Maddingley MBC34-26]